MSLNTPKHLGRAAVSGLAAGCMLVAATAGVAGAQATSGTAPSGTVTKVGKTSFTLTEPGGTVITTDVISGTTYQLTKVTTLSAIKVGALIKATGPLKTADELVASDLAIVPAPPAHIATSGVGTVPQGSFFYGKVITDKAGVVTISTDVGNRLISTSASPAVTVTTNATFAAVKPGLAVEVNGPEVNATLYTGHQINLGVTPAVVGLPS